MLICCIFAATIFSYLLTLKNKKAHTRTLAMFFLGGFLLDFGFLVAALFPVPAGAYHRFITVPGVFVPIVAMVQFAYHFPRNYHHKESRMVFIISIVIAAGLIAQFVIKALTLQPEFFFEGSLFNFPAEIGRFVAMGIMAMTLWFVVVMIRKARILMGEERRAVIQLLIAMVIPSVIPGVANTLHQQGKLDHLQFEQVFVITTLLGYFAITIVFINNTVERTSFMTKIVGISLLTILLVVQGLSMLVTSLKERNFDRIQFLEAKRLLVPGTEPPPEVAYILARPLRPKVGEGLTILLNREDAPFDISELSDSFPWGEMEEKRVVRRAEKFGTHLYYGYRILDGAQSRMLEVGFPVKVYRQFIDETSRSIVYFLLAIVFVVLILYPIFFARSLVRPLNALLGGVGEVNTGNLMVKIPVLVQDEIGFLSESFNKMVRSIMDARNELQRYAETLEDKVKERTREVTEKMEEIQGLKVQQDGDYYLTSLIEKPLETNWNRSTLVDTEFFIEQKKKFSFRNRHAELGGDICITGNLRFGSADNRYIVFMNGDAMGKSMQGAGGAIVLGTAMNNIIARAAGDNRVLSISPEQWLTQTFHDLHSIFKTFDGLMLASAVIGVISERTGEMHYFNAEHPWMCVYRNGKAEFIENELSLRKLGSPSEFTFAVKHYQLQPGDVLFAGSDGRDDLDMSGGAEKRVINEDESLFLRIVEEARGDTREIVKIIKRTGDITDDLSLLRIAYQPVGTNRAEGQKLFEEGRRKMDAGDAVEAIRLFEAAVAVSPDHAEALHNVAHLFYARAEYERCLEKTLEYLELVPEDGDAWFQVVLCYRQLRRFEEARDAGERLHQLQPGRVANLINLADSYRMLAEYATARKYLDEALRLSPDSTAGVKLDGIMKNRGF